MGTCKDCKFFDRFKSIFDSGEGECLLVTKAYEMEVRFAGIDSHSSASPDAFLRVRSEFGCNQRQPIEGEAR